MHKLPFSIYMKFWYNTSSLHNRGGKCMKKEKSSLWEWIKAILIAVVLAGVIRQFFFAPILVDGVSMAPTLHDAIE